MSSRQKICISHHCGWKYKCELYANGRELHNQYFQPEHIEDACHFYVARKPNWIRGDMEAEGND